MNRLLFKHIFFPSVITALLLFVFPASALPVSVNKGLADFSHVSLNEIDLADISGQWQFCYGKHLSANEMKSIADINKQFIEVPSSWDKLKDKKSGHNYPTFGIATYYLKIILPHDPNRNFSYYGLHIENVTTAYTLTVNDKPIMTAGIASADSLSFKPMFYPQSGAFSSATDTIDIILHATNFFEYHYSGVSGKVIFGSKKEVKLYTFRKTALCIFLMSVLFCFFLFHLFLGTLQKKKNSSLLIALLSLLFCIKMSLDCDVTIFHFFPDFSYATGYRLWMLSFMSIPIVFRLIKHSFPAEVNNIIEIFVYSVYLLLGIIFISFPTDIIVKNIFIVIYLTISLIVYIFYVLGKAVYKKRMYSIWHIISFTVMIVLFLNDLLYITNQSTTGYLSQIGVCFYILVQSAIVSRKYAESQKKVLELKDELEVVNRNLESTVEVRTKELSEANTKLNIFLRQKNFLISTLSHDLKNSFNILINFSTLLSDSEDLDENQKKDIARRLYETSTKGFMTLENVLGWARLQITNKSVKSEIGNLKFLIEDNIYIFSEQTRSKNLHLLVDINDNLKFLCDENHLNAIIRNLISNAIKFSKTDGRIIIMNEAIGEDVLIKIHDEGIGIPNSLINGIFEDNSEKRREGTSGEKGTGLGLIIVKELVESNNGKITCRSKLNEFTEFTISFPLSKV